MAASSRNLGGIRLLLQFGAEVNVKDDRGCTPLFGACKATGHRYFSILRKGFARFALKGSGQSYL